MLIYEKKFHLTDPIYVQFYYYVIGLAQGNLGVSPSRGFAPVTTVIEQTLPYTLQIAFFAIILTLLFGFVFGIIASYYHKKPIDAGIRAFYLGGYSSPPFFIGLLLLIIFVYVFHLLPSGGAVGISLTHAQSHHRDTHARCITPWEFYVPFKCSGARDIAQSHFRAYHVWGRYKNS